MIQNGPREREKKKKEGGGGGGYSSQKRLSAILNAAHKSLTFLCISHLFYKIVINGINEKFW